MSLKRLTLLYLKREGFAALFSKRRRSRHQISRQIHRKLAELPSKESRRKFRKMKPAKTRTDEWARDGADRTIWNVATQMRPVLTTFQHHRLVVNTSNRLRSSLKAHRPKTNCKLLRKPREIKSSLLAHTVAFKPRRPGSLCLLCFRGFVAKQAELAPRRVFRARTD